MKSAEIKDRIMGTILGTLIGDALGVGPHWYYDLDALRRDYGTWISDYTAPLPHRYHAGLEAGMNSQTGQVVAFLLESIAANGGYVEEDFTWHLDGLFATLDGTPHGGRYTDHAMRDVWKARKEGRDWKTAGSFADTAEAAIRVPVIAGRYCADFGKALSNILSNVQITHIDPFIAGQSTAFGLVVLALMNGVPLEDAPGFIRSEANKAGVSLAVPLVHPAYAGTGEPGSFPEEVPFIDAVLQPAWVHAAARDPAVKIEPARAVCRLFGLACTLGFMLPAAYYFASRFEGDFESAVLSAINGGGNNMARAALAGAVSGAMTGLAGIPERFISGLAGHKHILVRASRIADDAVDH